MKLSSGSFSRDHKGIAARLSAGWEATAGQWGGLGGRQQTPEPGVGSPYSPLCLAFYFPEPSTVLSHCAKCGTNERLPQSSWCQHQEEVPPAPKTRGPLEPC